MKYSAQGTAQRRTLLLVFLLVLGLGFTVFVALTRQDIQNHAMELDKSDSSSFRNVKDGGDIQQSGPAQTSTDSFGSNRGETTTEKGFGEGLFDRF